MVELIIFKLNDLIWFIRQERSNRVSHVPIDNVLVVSKYYHVADIAVIRWHIFGGTQNMRFSSKPKVNTIIRDRKQSLRLRREEAWVLAEGSEDWQFF